MLILCFGNSPSFGANHIVALRGELGTISGAQQKQKYRPIVDGTAIRKPMSEEKHISEVKREHSYRLLCTPFVVGVGVGRKVVKGKTTTTPCITAIVAKKIKSFMLPAAARIPEEIVGIPTDVISLTGDKPLLEARLRKSPQPHDERTRRWRPAPGGVSVGHYLLKGAGTLGAWIRDSKSGEAFMLSCWHVIANSGRCKKGNPVLQPAVLDGGRRPDDVIAYLDRWVDVRMIVPTRDLGDAKMKLANLIVAKTPIPTNLVDVALARPVSDEVVSDQILGLGKMTFSSSADDDEFSKIGQEITYSGRTSGVVQGNVRVVDVDIFVTYDTGIALFVDQLIA